MNLKFSVCGSIVFELIILLYSSISSSLINIVLNNYSTINYVYNYYLFNSLLNLFRIKAL